MTNPRSTSSVERDTRRRGLGATALLVALCSFGCANLTAIREFAAASSDAVGYRRVVDDYVTAPDRRARYAPCPECKQQKADRQKQEPALLAEQQALQAYMDALGALAADDLVDYSKEYGDLAAAASSAQLVPKQQSDAIATIASVLTKAATDAWRQHKLREIIEQTNGPVQTLIAGLQSIMGAFDVDVQIEVASANNHYGDLVHRSHDAAAIAAVQEWQALRVAEIQQRRDAVTAYRGVLATIGAGHQRLYDDRNHLANADTLRQIKQYARDLKKASKALQQLRG